MTDKNALRMFLTMVVGAVAWLFLNVSDLQSEQKLMQYQINEIMDTMKKNTDTLTTIHDKLHAQFGW